MLTLSKAIKTIFLFASINPMLDLNNRKQELWRICRETDKGVDDLWGKLRENAQEEPWKLRETMYKEIYKMRIALTRAFRATIKDGHYLKPEQRKTCHTLRKIDIQMQRMTVWIEGHQRSLEPGMAPFINTDKEREMLAPFIRTITGDLEKDAVKIKERISDCSTNGKPIPDFKSPTWKMINDTCKQITNLYTHALAIGLNCNPVEIIMDQLLGEAKRKGNEIRDMACELRKQSTQLLYVPASWLLPSPAYVDPTRLLGSAYVTPERPCPPIPANLPYPRFKDL